MKNKVCLWGDKIRIKRLRQGNLYTGGRCTTACAAVNQLFNLMSFYCEDQHEENGITSGHVGPQVPSGLIFKVFDQKLTKFVVVVRFV